MEKVTVMALGVAHCSDTSGILEEALGTPKEIVKRLHCHMGMVQTGSSMVTGSRFLWITGTETNSEHGQ